MERDGRKAVGGSKTERKFVVRSLENLGAWRVKLGKYQRFATRKRFLPKSTFF
jgi:hypothetical protein